MKEAMFGAGCFWGVEATFDDIPGVAETEVGYSGGTTDEPTYRDVCSGGTGHAEVVRVVYDPDRVSYDELLETFWTCHDPTQENRQGPDVGTQYRSVIFTFDEEQEEVARRSKEQLDASGRWSRPVATAIEPAPTFWRAEDYHQKYLAKRNAATCGR